MIKSMTGFGRATFENEKRSIIIEIKSVNHRYCDVFIKMPKSLVSLEDKIRSMIQANLGRGKIDVFLTLNTFDKKDVTTIVNTSLADSYIKCLNAIKERYNVKDDISISLIAKFPEVISIKQEEEDMEELWDNISIPLKEAINSLINMREKEGAKLQKNILEKCDNIKEILLQIEKRAPEIPIKYKEKLDARLKELLEDSEIDEARIAIEVALFADKACIDEEIVRLKSHLSQMKDTLKLKEPVGRKLDFIIQEMNRETNTIGSKANDLDISSLTLNIKNEIEKIREQIQNVE